MDTGRYLSALNLLREAEIDAQQLEDCSVAGGLDSYRELLRDKSYFDYSSLLEEAVHLLENDKALRRRLAGRLKHVIVDEYQDVNPIQERLVRCLHSLGAKICVVGDDDQTIYQWRGSDIEGILHFSERYPNVKQIRLQENFRSSEGIVETARAFIEQNTHRLEKTMVAASEQRHVKGDIAALGFDDPDTEAAFIVRTIQRLHGVAFTEAGKSRGLAYSDFTILLRSVNANGEPILRALRDAEIPMLIVGMNQLFETAEAAAARDLFYFLAGIEDVEESGLLETWLAADLGVTKKNLRQAIGEAARMKETIHGEAGERWSVYNLQRQFLQFLENIQLREECVPGEGRGERVFYNLGKFSQIISDFESIHFKSNPSKKYQDFASFLKYDAQNAYPEGWQANQYANPNAVKVMTVHQAKGMQWPVVFLPALLRNRFPAPKMGGPGVWHLVPEDAVQGSERFKTGEEDERRLFYVAMTRSQKFLFMSWAPIEAKGNRYRQPSIFWKDIQQSRFVVRQEPDLTARKRLPSRPKESLSQVVLSFSELKYFFECPYQFKLRIL